MFDQDRKPCPFCQIATTDFYSQVLAANQKFALFRSNRETTENHLMTIPKKHVTENASKTPKELVRDLVTNAIRLATENDPIFSDLRFKLN